MRVEVASARVPPPGGWDSGFGDLRGLIKDFGKVSGWRGAGGWTRNIFSHKVFTNSFCKSQFPQKSVNVSFVIADIKNELTDLCGN